MTNISQLKPFIISDSPYDWLILVTCIWITVPRHKFSGIHSASFTHDLQSDQSEVDLKKQVQKHVTWSILLIIIVQVYLFYKVSYLWKRSDLVTYISLCKARAQGKILLAMGQLSLKSQSKNLIKGYSSLFQENCSVELKIRRSSWLFFLTLYFWTWSVFEWLYSLPSQYRYS